MKEWIVKQVHKVFLELNKIAAVSSYPQKCCYFVFNFNVQWQYNSFALILSFKLDFFFEGGGGEGNHSLKIINNWCDKV